MKLNSRFWMISSFLLVSSLYSCKKNVLDTVPLDRISQDIVWSSKNNAETFLFSTYDNIMYGVAPDIGIEAYTPNLLPADGAYNGAYGVFSETIDRFKDQGFNNWSQVRKCNLIIDKVTTSTGIGDDDKKTLIAEAKFLRAMTYFNVARRVGRIVWIDKVLDPNDNLLLPSTATPAESYDYIIKDLEDAYQDLPTGKVSGRANKYVAAAFLSEVCLQALAYQDYPNTLNIAAKTALVDKSIKYANIVINEGGYSLEADYGAMFNDTNPTSNEIIFAIYRKAINTTCENTPMQRMIPNVSNDHITRYGGTPLFKSPIQIFEAWIEHTPTQNLSEEYLVRDQQDANKAVRWDQTSQYKAAVQENVTIPGSIITINGGDETPVTSAKVNDGSNETVWTLSNIGRDARWNASIVSDSSALYGETVTTCVKGNLTRFSRIAGIGYGGLSNLYWRKGIYNNVKPRIYVGVPTDYHYVVMRLGRVYLNLAEAYLLKKDLGSALTAMNKTRVTHGQLPPSMASTLTEAWTDYKRERRVDLTLENDYYWSLLRWGRFGGDANHGIASGGTIPELTEVPKIIDISKDRKYYKVIKGSFFGQNSNRVFNPQRRYLFPISQDYINNNSNFGPQNPGW